MSLSLDKLVDEATTDFYDWLDTVSDPTLREVQTQIAEIAEAAIPKMTSLVLEVVSSNYVLLYEKPEEYLTNPDPMTLIRANIRNHICEKLNEILEEREES